MQDGNGRQLLQLTRREEPALASRRATVLDSGQSTVDCLLVGFNDFDFTTYVRTVKSMGKDSGAPQDLRLAFVEMEGKLYRALDVLTKFHAGGAEAPAATFHNSDFLWPVITYLGSFLAKHGFTFDYVNLSTASGSSCVVS
ncbi:MAG: hypothetical protein ACRDZO_08055 [Egibacteraceae bacterium]